MSLKIQIIKILSVDKISLITFSKLYYIQMSLDDKKTLEAFFMSAKKTTKLKKISLN